MSPSISWKTPKLLELDPSPPAPVETEESRAQRERESRVLSTSPPALQSSSTLPFFFYSSSFLAGDISFSLRDKTIDLSKIPPSPAEAPAEPEEGPPPVDIPFDEVPTRSLAAYSRLSSPTHYHRSCSHLRSLLLLSPPRPQRRQQPYRCLRPRRRSSARCQGSLPRFLPSLPPCPRRRSSCRHPGTSRIRPLRSRS
jgi:hypothetical protein